MYLSKFDDLPTMMTSHPILRKSEIIQDPPLLFTQTLPKKSFWQKLKDLFKSPPPKTKLEDLPFVQPQKPYGGVVLTTFAGCDIKPKLVPHMQGDYSDYWLAKGTTLGEVQAISFVCKKEVLGGVTLDVTRGSLTAILFMDSCLPKLDVGDVDLVLSASTEYGDVTVMVLPNFKITSLRYGIGIDDLVSEETFTFEADAPMVWKSIRIAEFPNRAKPSNKN